MASTVGLLLDMEKSDFQNFPKIGIIHEAVSDRETRDFNTRFMHTAPVAITLASAARGGERC